MKTLQAVVDREKKSGMEKKSKTGTLQHSASEDLIFDHLFRTQYKKMCRAAYTFLENFDAAEDVVQEVFSEMWEKKTLLKKLENPEDYLFIAIRNSCFTYLRDKKKIVPIEECREEMASDPDNNNIPEELMPLWNALEELPEQCKIIFKQVVLEDMTYQEVATCLGISLNTVKTHMKIAYRTLREKLDSKKTLFFLWLFHRKFFTPRSHKTRSSASLPTATEHETASNSRAGHQI